MSSSSYFKSIQLPKWFEELVAIYKRQNLAICQFKVKSYLDKLRGTYQYDVRQKHLEPLRVYLDTAKSLFSTSLMVRHVSRFTNEDLQEDVVKFAIGQDTDIKRRRRLYVQLLKGYGYPKPETRVRRWLLSVRRLLNLCPPIPEGVLLAVLKQTVGSPDEQCRKDLPPIVSEELFAALNSAIFTTALNKAIDVKRSDDFDRLLRLATTQTGVSQDTKPKVLPPPQSMDDPFVEFNLLPKFKSSENDLLLPTDVTSPYSDALFANGRLAPDLVAVLLRLIKKNQPQQVRWFFNHALWSATQRRQFISTAMHRYLKDGAGDLFDFVWTMKFAANGVPELQSDLVEAIVPTITAQLSKPMDGTESNRHVRALKCLLGEELWIRHIAERARFFMAADHSHVAITMIENCMSTTDDSPEWYLWYLRHIIKSLEPKGLLKLLPEAVKSSRLAQPFMAELSAKARSCNITTVLDSLEPMKTALEQADVGNHIRLDYLVFLQAFPIPRSYIDHILALLTKDWWEDAASEEVVAPEAGMKKVFCRLSHQYDDRTRLRILRLITKHLVCKGSVTAVTTWLNMIREKGSCYQYQQVMNQPANLLLEACNHNPEVFNVVLANYRDVGGIGSTEQFLLACPQHMQWVVGFLDGEEAKRVARLSEVRLPRYKADKLIDGVVEKLVSSPEDQQAAWVGALTLDMLVRVADRVADQQSSPVVAFELTKQLISHTHPRVTKLLVENLLKQFPDDGSIEEAGRSVDEVRKCKADYLGWRDVILSNLGSDCDATPPDHWREIADRPLANVICEIAFFATQERGEAKHGCQEEFAPKSATNPGHLRRAYIPSTHTPC